MKRISRDKTDAIIDLVTFENNWRGWLAYNNEKEMMYKYLDEVAEDIYKGYITYDAFEETMIYVSARVGQSEGDKVDDFLLYLKKTIISKYKTIGYIK